MLSSHKVKGHDTACIHIAKGFSIQDVRRDKHYPHCPVGTVTLCFLPALRKTGQDWIREHSEN